MTQIALRKIARTVWILALAALFCASWQFAQAQDSDDDPVQPPTDTKNYVPSSPALAAHWPTPKYSTTAQT